MLQANTLTFGYNFEPPCIKEKSISVAAGEVVGLPGASGVGKSTFASLLAGFLRPHSGSISCDGQPLADRGFSTVQLLFQHPELAVNPRWKAGKIMEEGNPRYRSLMAAFGVRSSWLNRYPHELSGGELQRIALLRAMNDKLRYLIADEITSSLDTATQALIWNALLPWAKEREIGILLISHNSHLLNRVCSRIDRSFVE